MKTIAVIPAGGQGKRTGSEIPKQYLKFNGKELIAFTLEVFQQCSLIDEIVVAAKPEYIPLLKKIKVRYDLTKIKTLVEGGSERQFSVFNALSSLDCSNKDLVVVHDAARPLLPPEVLKRAVLAAQKKGNALVCLKARDTIIRGKSTVEDYIERKEIFIVQTPQVFRYSDLFNALKKANSEGFIGTDESSVMKRYGKRIYIVEGSLINFKITDAEDLELFRMLITAGKDTSV
ncbi:MAG: 2-C-methyl-D-erythritol 4-phosphate cytidylyltransferase [Ignavibacteriaceae bacterium]